MAGARAPVAKRCLGVRRVVRGSLGSGCSGGRGRDQISGGKEAIHDAQARGNHFFLKNQLAGGSPGEVPFSVKVVP